MCVFCVWEPGVQPSVVRGWLFARTRAAGAPVQGPRPLTRITGWLACALLRIKISDEVDPSARQKWPNNAKGLRVVRGFKGVGDSITLSSRRYVSSEKPDRNLKLLQRE